MFSTSSHVFSPLVCTYPELLKADCHIISLSGSFVNQVDHLSGLGSGLGFIMGMGSSV